MLRRRINPYFMFFGMVFTFLLAFTLSIYLNMGDARDEFGRYYLTSWIYRNNRLPVGNEEEIQITTWGMSYAYRTYLPNIVGAVCMKIATVFGVEEGRLLIAARFPSVVSYVLIFVFSYLIGAELFGNKDFIPELLAISVVSIPQVIYLSAYINMDEPALAECVIIFYLLILGVRHSFSRRICILLGAIIGIALLTYYNTASVIVLCVPVILYSTLVREKESIVTVIIRYVITALSTIVVSGGAFIRRAVLYNGDFTGLRTEALSRELNAQTDLKPSVLYNGINSGKGIIEYFIPNGFLAPDSWFYRTYRDMIGLMGLTIYKVPDWIYVFFIWFWIIGGIAFLIWIIFGKARLIDRLALLLIYISAVLLPWLLSVYQSWTRDFQPQGRHVVASVIPLMIASLVGISGVVDLLGEKLGIHGKIYKLEKICYAILIVVIIYAAISSVMLSLTPHCLNTDEFNLLL